LLLDVLREVGPAAGNHRRQPATGRLNPVERNVCSRPSLAG
jgi:hypothetical protein